MPLLQIGRGRFGNINGELYTSPCRQTCHCLYQWVAVTIAHYKLSSEFISGLIEIIASGI